MQSRLLLCLLPVFAVGMPAQTVHVVGPGGLPQISSALAIAAPGDIVHVQPGTYAPFSITIGCTIRGLAQGTVYIHASSGPNEVAIHAPSAQVVHLADLDFSGIVTTRITGGRVTMDRCSLRNASDEPLSISNADVHLQGCSIACDMPAGLRPGILASNARITAIDSELSGSPPTPSQYLAQPGIYMTNTTLHASGCTIRAGINPLFPAAGVYANGGELWLSDCSVTGNQSCAINAGGAAVLADRCVLQPTSASCPPPSSGGLLAVARPQPLQNGAVFSLAYKTTPNGYAAVFASQELATLAIPGLHAQTQWLGLGVINLGVVFADAAGNATAAWHIPAATWLIDQPLWFQGLTGFALPLQLSPVAGGLIR